LKNCIAGFCLLDVRLWDVLTASAAPNAGATAPLVRKLNQGCRNLSINTALVVVADPQAISGIVHPEDLPAAPSKIAALPKMGLTPLGEQVLEATNRVLEPVKGTNRCHARMVQFGDMVRKLRELRQLGDRSQQVEAQIASLTSTTDDKLVWLVCVVDQGALVSH
jgi:hypothetical protein